jgi:hypothetical protein
MIRKEVILATLTTFCLTVTLFSLAPVMSSMPYDPWADIRGTDPNDPNSPDGKVDMRDIGYIATMFTATGDPTKVVKVGSYDSSTLTQNITIPAHTSGNINITTDGYSRMTLGLTTSEGGNPITVNTGFMIGSFYAHMDNISLGSSSGNYSRPANSIWLEPSTIPLKGKTPGYKFNVTAWINLNTLSFTWQVKCTFDGTVFAVTRAGYTAGSQSHFFSGCSTIPITPLIGGDYVIHGETLVSGSRSAGSDSLCWFEFQVIAPSTEEQLVINYPGSDTFALNPDLNVIDTTNYGALASWNVSTSEGYETFRTYSVIGPILRIDYYNPNDDAASLKIDTYLTTAP